MQISNNSMRIADNSVKSCGDLPLQDTTPPWAILGVVRTSRHL